MSWWKVLLLVFGLLVLGGVGTAWYLLNVAELDPYVPLYADNCAQCHGAELEGTDSGLALVGMTLARGDSVTQLQQSIREAHVNSSVLADLNELSDVEVKGLAIYIGERRLGQRFTDFRYDRAINQTREVQVTAQHRFTIERVIDGLDPLVFSIEPMPDGYLLLSEKERGLSIISPQGTRSEPLQGTPATGGSFDVLGVQFGVGWLLDVALHPDYANNGWVYLHHTHLCTGTCAGLVPKSMNRLVRGRIEAGQWQEMQVLWQAPDAFYTTTPDTGAGGRIAFDDFGHVFFSTGIKTENAIKETAAQDLDVPYGKVHRLHDDGRIPRDNPFVVHPTATPGASLRDSLWTYGHRSPQGLEWHPVRKRVWNSEMGPRGGDELNELLPGRNYGWPFHSNGLEYLGTSVERHKANSIEFDDSEVEHTLVDITPSPAISSFVFYQGLRFPNWQGDVLIGSLKGSSLYRMVFDGNELVSQETLISDLARIRDVEVGFDGLVYLLVETKTESAILKLVPVT